LAGGQNHTYRISLSAGQYLKVIVEQQGIDVVVQLSGPDGEQIAEFDSERRSWRQELAQHVAGVDGEYRLVVLPRQKNALAGGYEIRIEELRDATDDDRALHEARKLLQEERQLANANKYEEALPLIERALEIRERVLGMQATKSALKQLHSPGILHIATHGFFLRDQEIELVGGRDVGEATVRSASAPGQPIENPLLRSGLALAGANLRSGHADQGPDQGDDGILTALEAAGLDLMGTKLVALSACDTGVGKVKNGEGVFGLRRALALAGSETQIMSLLMIEYYKRLRSGEGRGDGLRSVQLEMLKSKNRRHPFYWASFIQSGEWANLEGER
jgi:CHAT domain-containing protein